MLVLLKISLVVVAAGYIGLLVLLYLGQEWLMFPGKTNQGTTYAQVQPGEGEELLSLQTPSGDIIAALFGRALTPDGKIHADAKQCPTLIYFYGNGMCLQDALYEFGEYRRLGVNMIVPDYLGYGLSSGTPSEQGCYIAADAVYDHLRSRTDIDQTKIIALGRSLGSGVAVDLAARKPLAGLITFSAYTSMVEMGKASYPVVPVSMLLKHRFESIGKIQHVKCPILFGHGKRDDVIPFTMTHQLAQKAQAPVTEFYVDHLGHNDFWGETTLRPLQKFLNQF